MSSSRPVLTSMDRRSNWKAEAAGITPKEHVDKIAGVIRGLCDLLNISMISSSVLPMRIMRSRYRRSSSVSL